MNATQTTPASAAPPTDLTMYYDGACHLCSREIDHYRRSAKNDPGVTFVDISDPAFDAKALGMDPVFVQKHMHVRDGRTMHTGVDAFVAIWRRLPGHAWMARVATWPVVYQLLWAGYYVFAWVRPWLPRRKAACDTGACRR